MFLQRRSNARGGRIWLRMVLVIVLLLGTALLVEGFKESPPYHAMAGVDATLRAAEDADAPRYDPALFSMATRLRGAAQSALDAETRRFRWFRDYDGVNSYLVASRSLAVAAENRAEEAAASAGQHLEERLSEMDEAIRSAFATVEGYPYRGSVRKTLAEGSLLHARAVQAFKSGEIVVAATLADRADTLLSKSRSAFDSEFGGYLDRTGYWGRLASEGITHSRSTGGDLILVDKMRRRCYLYERGRRVLTFAADLGPNFIGDKTMSGDKATPEGKYRITEKKANGRTRYHKALLINYPNDEDRKQFAAAKKAGRISRHAAIGGLIEIHGDGGRGYDWTLGCVALANKDMDKLYARVSVGTPVIIVGTLPDQLALAQ
jgi:L,D-transpeptidase catalytic domain